MLIKPLLICIFLTIAIIPCFFCKKDDAPVNPALYGQWKTSYGDTITFAQENGKNIITYDLSMNANLPVKSKKEFAFRNNKLGIRDGLNGNDFRFLQTFKWNTPHTSFEVQGVEWFLFISSTTTYFTFTKI